MQQPGELTLLQSWDRGEGMKFWPLRKDLEIISKLVKYKVDIKNTKTQAICRHFSLLNTVFHLPAMITETCHDYRDNQSINQSINQSLSLSYRSCSEIQTVGKKRKEANILTFSSKEVKLVCIGCIACRCWSPINKPTPVVHVPCSNPKQSLHQRSLCNDSLDNPFTANCIPFHFQTIVPHTIKP